jgi:sigma-B regulation protein RsbU (phosphoserine phosphatase)
MKLPAGSRILLAAHASTDVDDVRRLLEQAGYGVDWHPTSAPEPDNPQAFQLVIQEDGRHETQAPHFCRRLRDKLGEAFVPVLFVTSDPSPAARLASFKDGADTYLLRPFAPGELLAQVQALLRIKEVHDRLADKTAEIHRMNKRLQQAHQQMDQELEMARRLQQSFLPRVLPEMPGARFAVSYRLCGRVGGDSYDIFRLDEDHVGFYVADAMGHGVPASLLTIFVKKGVQAKEINGKNYRLVPPNEVLQKLNADLVEQALPDIPFITMIYALLNCRDGTLTFARAGHPHPLYVPFDAAPQFLEIHGSLLGVFDTEFQVRTQQLRSGDKLLLYSDGIDTATYQENAPGTASLAACAAEHRGLPIQDMVDCLARDLFASDERPDDLTLFGVEMV